uniref:NADH-ubiquinone oxidoreductase chain 5 n=1 Tax=Brachytemnus porcatus TaxID=1069889 RepID=J9PJS2_9CUCU|nr:NADH dehydrogenase subunit 5 [Brachytemnus porcatus]
MFLTKFFFFLLSSFVMYLSGLSLAFSNHHLVAEFDLLRLNSGSMVYVVSGDWISFFFMGFVFFISSMVVKYSSSYMEGDKKINRFVLLVGLFVFSMMFMIFSPNMVSILLGWDGLGLVSYALVLYYQNMKSYNAGMLTALSNRIGDVALLLSIAWMTNLGSWNFMAYIELMKETSELMIISLLILLAAFTKSAQMPFSAWLPAAMAAPTPVSSLVHSSTLVTAGVYLLIRFSTYFFELTNMILLYMSLLTMFMAGLAANYEYDLKKIIALSTLSQLGMMMVILAMGATELAFFHLIVHASFKALLFMCAGAMIHSLNGFQDIRYMGGVIYTMPFTCTCFCMSSFSLSGLPFLSGFYSKDLMAEYMAGGFTSFLIYLLFFLSIGLTVSYSMRLIYYVFFGDCSSLTLNSYSDLVNGCMLKGMSGLILLIVAKGSVFTWMCFTMPYFVVIPYSMKFATFYLVIVGGVMGFWASLEEIDLKTPSFLLKNKFLFFVNMWNLTILSSFGLNSYFLKIGKFCFKGIDQGWLEYYGSKGLFSCMKTLTQILQFVLYNHFKFMLLIVFIFSLYTYLTSF